MANGCNKISSYEWHIDAIALFLAENIKKSASFFHQIPRKVHKIVSSFSKINYSLEMAYSKMDRQF